MTHSGQSDPIVVDRDPREGRPPTSGEIIGGGHGDGAYVLATSGECVA